MLTDIDFAISFFNYSTHTGVVASKRIREFDLHADFTLCFWLKVEEEPTLNTDLLDIFNLKTLKSDMFIVLDKNREIKFFYQTNTYVNRRSSLVDVSNAWEPYCLKKEARVFEVSTRSQNGSVTTIGEYPIYSSPRKLQHQQMIIIGHSETRIGTKGEFKGSIAHLFLYSKALSTDQIAEFFDKNPPMENVGFGWWDFKNQALPGYSKETKPFS